MGNDTRTQMVQIRKDIGICLQHDCLFPALTVREHIQFFSRVKGLYGQLPFDEAEAHVDQALRDVALAEKRNTLSDNLSGGMKRKLSVAIAFCGGSKVVLLDEVSNILPLLIAILAAETLLTLCGYRICSQPREWTRSRVASRGT
jgi:ABC-type multidrug transport system ATPase subunit